MTTRSRNVAAIGVLGLLGLVAPACQSRPEKDADPLQGQLHSNICQEGRALPQRLETHLDPDGQIAAALAADHPDGIKSACLELERNTRETCGRLDEFERICSGSATLLGFRDGETWGSDPFGRDLCNQLLLTAMFCEDQPDQTASKAARALADFGPELSKRLAGFLSSCP